MHPRRQDERGWIAGPIYTAIERALWALAPVLFAVFLLSLPSLWASRQQSEAQASIEIAAENIRYCEKWGMQTGSIEHLACIRDLVGIRARTEQSLRDQLSDGI